MSLEIVSKWQLYLAKEHIGKAYASTKQRAMGS
jgi:hypothetical protein